MTRLRIFDLFHKTKTKTLNITTAAVLVMSSLGSTLPLLLNTTAHALSPSSPVVYSNGFETNTADWTDVTRTASNPGGVTASSGSYYGNAADGAFTKWGGYQSAFPAGGYTTKVDVYLDTSLATGGADKRFDFSSAINQPSGDHRRDFIFNLGTNPSVDGQWAASVSNNAPGWPLNPSRNPVAITQTGWYTLESNFHDNGSGVLAVTMSVVKTSDNSVVGSWTLSDPSDVIGTTVGGHRYGWIVNEQSAANEIPSLAIDNASLTLNIPAPAAPTSLFFTNSASANVVACGSTVNTYAGTTLHWTVPTGTLKQYQVVPNYPDNHGEYTYYPAGSASSVWVGDNFGRHGDGTYSYEIQAQGANGLWGDVATCTLSYDSTAPTVTVTPAAGTLLHDTETFTITVNDNNPLDPSKNKSVWVYLYDTAGSQKSQGAKVDLSSGHGTFTVDTTKLLDGNANLDVAIVYDAVGNASGKTDNYFRNYTIDNTAPTGLAHVSPSNGTVTTTAGLTLIDWTDATDSHGPVTYYYESSHSSATNADGSFVSPVYQSGVLTDSQIPTAGTSEGIYYWHVRAVDAAGNSTAWTNAWMVTVDDTAPAVPTLTFPADGVYRHAANTNHSDWSVVTDPHGPVTYYYESAYDQAFTHIAYGPQALSAHTILNPGEPEGTYYWRVKACDVLGNCSAWSAPRTIHIDNTAPHSFTLTGPSPVGNSFKNTTNFNFTWNASTDTNGVTYKICRSQIAPAAGVVRCDWGWTVPGANGTHFPFNSTFTGNHGNTTWYWQVTATDPAGNSTRSNIGKVTFDTTRPTVSFTAPTDFSTPFAVGPNVTVHATDANGLSALVIHVYDSSNTLLGICGSANAAELTTGSMSCDLSGLADGTYSIKAGANDKAGNNKTVNSGIFTIDSVAPKVTVNTLTTTDTTPAVTGTVDDSSATVSVIVNGHTYAATVATTANASGTYDWSADVTDALPAGTYDVAATAKDAAGNTGTDATTDELVVTVTGGRGAGVTTLAVTQTAANNSQDNNTDGQVLGAATTPKTTSNDSSNDDNDVKGDSTVKLQTAATKKHSFLGFGWWWLVILALLAALWLAFVKRRRDDEK